MMPCGIPVEIDFVAISSGGSPVPRVNLVYLLPPWGGFKAKKKEK
jgi:hypothetical protein